MMRFPRPTEPNGFCDAVRPAVENLQRALADRRKLTKDDFPELWRDYKSVLASAQHGKCGFCERDITTHGGDVEHFHPKAALEELPADRARWGRDDPYTGQMKESRRLNELCDRGYSWLAYEWTNYLVACESCNQKWKRCLFPVAESPRNIPPSPDKPETPLLLHPFGADDPVKHLRFSDIGSVEPRDMSERGRATIDTCGLDRPSLARARSFYARTAYELVRELLSADSPEATERALRQLRENGRPEAPHAGMVRSVFEVLSGADWTEIE